MNFHDPYLTDKPFTWVDDNQRAIDKELQKLSGRIQLEHADRPILVYHKVARETRQWVFGIPKTTLPPRLEESTNTFEVGEIVWNKNSCAKSYVEHLASGRWRFANKEEITKHNKHLEDSANTAQALKQKNDPALANERMVAAIEALASAAKDKTKKD